MAKFKPNNEQSFDMLSSEPERDFAQVDLKPRWSFILAIL